MGLKPRSSAAAKPIATGAPVDAERWLRVLAKQIEAFALRLPGATEEHPWGETVAKVGGKVFVFLGRQSLDRFGFAVKLPDSAEGILSMPFASPTGYGLGRSGWVSISCTVDDSLPAEFYEDLILESYRAIAPKRFINELK